MKTKIALIYAGGTVGMFVENGSLTPPSDASAFSVACDEIVQGFQQDYACEVAFHFFDTKDSSDRMVDDWKEMYLVMQDLQKTHDAIVVAHGTDTLSYTSAAMGLCFSHPDCPGKTSLKIPIVFTASQIPIFHNGGDGRFNLYNALNTANAMAEKKLNRVCISFNDKILLASRSIKTHDKYFDAFDTPAVPYVGRVTAVGVELSESLRPLEYADAQSPAFCASNVVIEVSPSIPNGTILKASQLAETKVIILKTLGEGNIPSRLQEEISSVIQSGSIVVLNSPFSGGSVGAAIYELGAEIIRVGAIPAGDMVAPMTDVKCSWLIGNGVTDRDEFAKRLQQDHIGEITLK